MSKTANIRVRGSQPLNRISPYLWGNFIEDLRDHMDAMLAYPIKGMDFEQEADSTCNVSGAWTPITNGRTTHYQLEPAAPLHSGHSQRIKIYSADNGFAGLSQRISVQANTTYMVRVYARASIEIKTAVIDLVNPSTGSEYDSTTIAFTSHDWRDYQCELTVPAGCTEAVFRIRVFAGQWEDSEVTGFVWFDHVSILPTDHVAGVKRSVFELTKALNCGMLRFGGNHISSYHWKHFVGPIAHRPSMLNEVWGGWATKYFGTDELIEFCRRVGVEPLICINFGSGTPEEAAEWIEYCNGDSTTPMGALRAANGHPEPYNVRYWEVGNEVFGKWQIGHCPASEYATRYLEFASAMRAAGPTIKLIACGHFDTDWNKAVLQTAGKAMDMLSIHIYPGIRNMGQPKDASSLDVFKTLRCFPEYTRTILRSAAELIDRDEHLRHIKLALTEYNTMYQPREVRQGIAYEHTLQSAVANAANLNEFIRNSDLIDIATFSDLVNGWQGGCIRVGNFRADQIHGEVDSTDPHHAVYGTPTYHVLKLYGNSRIDQSVQTSTTCDNFQIEGQHAWTTLEEAQKLDVVAGLDADASRLIVLVVNRGLEDIDCDFLLEGFDSETGRVHEIWDEDLDAQNTICKPHDVTCAETGIHLSENQFHYTLRAHAVYGFELLKN